MNNNIIFGFFRELFITEQLVRNKTDRTLPGDMTTSQFALLTHLIRSGQSQTPAELANAFQVKRPTMTNTIQKLELKGFVTLTTDTHDRRSKWVQITKRGIKAHDEALQSLMTQFAPMIDDLGTQIFADCLSELQKIRHYLDTNSRE